MSDYMDDIDIELRKHMNTIGYRKLKELEQELADTKKEFERVRDISVNYASEITQLEAFKKEALEVIGLYANEVNWQGNDGDEEKGYKMNRLCYEFCPPVDDSEELFKEENYGADIPVIKCGKRARSFLQKHTTKMEG